MKTSHNKNRFLSGIAQITFPPPNLGKLYNFFLDVKNDVSARITEPRNNDYAGRSEWEWLFDRLHQMGNNFKLAWATFHVPSFWSQVVHPALVQMAIGQCATNSGKWGIPEENYKNFSQ